jgi:cephalosporin hydroxylase
LSYDEVLQAKVSENLEFMKSRASKLLENGDFLHMPQESIEEALSSITPANDTSWWKGRWRGSTRWHSFLYVVTRILRPNVVVETGVLYGHSSAAILAALEENRSGRLVSVDLPIEEHRSITVGGRSIQDGIISDELSVGCAIPLNLHSRWSLQFGNSLDLLPNILSEVGPISIFVHDSLHTYDHMMSEFRLGYHALEHGGLLVSDDVDYNSAWLDFCNSKNLKWSTLSKVKDSSGQFAFALKSNST